MADSMAAKWAWDVYGVNFEGGPSIPFREFTQEEFAQWVYAMDRATTVFEVLGTAKARFESGQMDYAGACVRLRSLLDEFEKAARAVGSAARAISTLFVEVDGKQEKFSALSGEDLDRFVREALPILQERLAKPKATEELVENGR
jgi:hypothetical protein